MIKLFAVLALFAIGCGRSECADYCTTACQKSVACDAPPGSRTADIKVCESTCEDGVSAQRLSEATCKSARENVSAMSCDAYRAFIAKNTR